VNSANVGLNGDAIENELIPAVEKKFRAIGQGWRIYLWRLDRPLEALAVQVFYPEHYNGALPPAPTLSTSTPIPTSTFTTTKTSTTGGRAQARGAVGHARLSGPHLDYQ